MAKGEWTITPEDEGTYKLVDHDGEVMMRCFPEQDFAVSFYFNLLERTDLSFWMTKVIVLTEAAKTSESIQKRLVNG